MLELRLQVHLGRDNMDISIKKEDIVKGKIIDISHDGKGILKPWGYTVFTQGGIIGDEVSVKIIETKKNYAIGKTMAIDEPSKHRVEPMCKISNICGGCQLQELDYGTQLQIKTNKVKNDLVKIGGLDDVIIHDTIGMKEPYRYRNKVQIPVGREKGETVIGFYKKGSHVIANTNTCIIQHEIADKAIEAVRKYMKEFNIEPYDAKTGQGHIRHIIVKTSFETKDTMVIIVTNKEHLPNKNQLLDRLKRAIPELKSLIHNINNKKTNIVMGIKTRVIYGEDHIIDYIGDLKFKISGESFFQVNPVQTEVLYKKALEYAGLKGDEIVFDIYCGIGTISLLLAQKSKKVYGIESVKEAIVDAKENAKINGINNVEFHCGNAEEVFPELYSKGIKADVVVVDPPRKGCDTSVLDTIIKMQPEKVVYVSCNPSTLARDLKYLSQNGFEALEVQPVDMFPQGVHVEVIVGIQRSDL